MVIVDLETTGLLADTTIDPEAQPGIVQIGLVEIDADWEYVREHSWLVNPEKLPHLWEADAIKTHGIDPKDVMDAPTLPAILPSLAPIFRRHDTWVGYNNTFDRRVLYYQCVRYGWGWKFPWPSKDIDIMSVGKDYMNIAGKQGPKAPKLVELYKHIHGVEYSNAHNAMSDCHATLCCGQRLNAEGLVFS